MSLPKTYKAAQIATKDGKFEIVERQLPTPTEGQVLVKTRACGICHSDGVVVHQYLPTGLPRVPGHEIIGDVVAIGPGEKLWKVGDRVGGGWHGGHCGICSSCRAGDFVTCVNQNINGIMTDGGYAEYVILRSESVASIPRDVDPKEAASLLCAGVTTFNSLRHMDVHPGDIVAVQGVGGLGHLAIQFANKMGFKTVALSTSASKEKLAKKLGAQVYLDGSKVDVLEELRKMGGAKVAVATAPHAESISKLTSALAVGGTVLVLAVAPGPIQVNAMDLISKRTRVQGWPSGTAKDSEDTISFCQSADIKPMIETFTLDKVQEGYDKMMVNKVNFRGILVFD